MKRKYIILKLVIKYVYILYWSVYDPTVYFMSR